MKVVMLRGLPGSGKTSWALKFLSENPTWRRVNKDELRVMLWGSKKPKNNEGHLDQIQNHIIVDLLTAGFSVIVDNTHLSPKRERQLRDLVDSFNEINRKDVEFEVKFFDTPVWRCILNDASRGADAVGEKTIGRMYEQFLKPTPIERDPNLRNCYVFDLDGTLALHDRSPYNYKLIHTDRENEHVASVARILSENHLILFVSGRPEEYRDATVEWLSRIGFVPSELGLLMRKTGDNRADVIVKREIYEEHIKGKYNILGVFDDRTQVVEGCWRPLGLTVFQVAPGFF